MAIGSVKELIDYERETIKIAKKHGGDGNVDLSVIADAYDNTKTTQTPYSKGDLVTNDGKLWKANNNIMTKAGAFDTEMWDAIYNYNPEETYNVGDLVVYSGEVYRCTANTTGEWDSTKWSSQYAPSYDVTNSYYSVGSIVEYAGAYYSANSDYHNAPIGDFDRLLWTETTVETCLPKSLTHTLCSASEIRTDANGYVTNTLSYPSGTFTTIEYRYTTSMPMMGTTCMVQVEHGCISGSNQTRLRLVDASGQPLASITEGISDMGSLILFYLTI